MASLHGKKVICKSYHVKPIFESNAHFRFIMNPLLEYACIVVSVGLGYNIGGYFGSFIIVSSLLAGKTLIDTELN